MAQDLTEALITPIHRQHRMTKRGRFATQHSTATAGRSSPFEPRPCRNACSLLSPQVQRCEMIMWSAANSRGRAPAGIAHLATGRSKDQCHAS